MEVNSAEILTGTATPAPDGNGRGVLVVLGDTGGEDTTIFESCDSGAGDEVGCIEGMG